MARRITSVVATVLAICSITSAIAEQPARARSGIQGAPVTGFAYRDDDGDGVRDPLEPMVPGFVVTLTDPDGNSATATTANDGSYTVTVAALTGNTFLATVAPPNPEWVAAPPGRDSTAWTKLVTAGSTVSYGGQLGRVSARPASLTCYRTLVTSTTTSQLLSYQPGTNWSADGVFAPNPDTVADRPSGPYGLAYGPNGNIYIAASGSDEVRKYDGTTGAYLGTFIAAGSGGLSDPRGIALGPDGYWYVASRGTNSIKRYTIGGTYVDSPVVGGGTSLLQMPQQGLMFTTDGDLWVTSESSGSTGRVLRYDTSTWTLKSSWATTNVPRDLELSPTGTVYVARAGTTGAITEIDPTTGIMTARVASPAATSLSLSPDRASLYALSGTTVRQYRISDWALTNTFTLTGGGGNADMLWWRTAGSGCRDVNTVLGDRVWSDTNADGRQDINEPGIPGVTVSLVDIATDTTYPGTTNDDTVLASAITDSTGSFSFTLTPSGDPNQYTSISVGYAHACATTDALTLWCWGYNVAGRLGDGTLVNRSAPVQVGTASTWSSVDAGNAHTCGIQITGTLWCWGQNSFGQIGNGATANRLTPTRVGTATNWASVSAGTSHTCAVKTDGTLWCWGSNQYGQLGDGTLTSWTTPRQIGTANTWARVSAGQYFTCAVRSTGTLWCWGHNASSRLGDGTIVDRSSPVQIGTATTWNRIATGTAHGCATQTDGTLWCWGNNKYGRLGDGSTVNRSTPTKVGSATTWSVPDAGQFHTCATRTNGTLWCWGFNKQFQLGDGSTTTRRSPVQIGNVTTYTGVGTGGYFSCARRSDGQVWCWGQNTYGQVGDNSKSSRKTPVRAQAGLQSSLTANYVLAFDNTADFAVGGALYGRPVTPLNAAGTPANLDSDLRSSGATYFAYLSATAPNADADLGWQENPTVITVGDTVWEDIDNDGVQDADEYGLGGVTVELLSGAGALIDSAITDADGHYYFPGRPAGSYIVRVPAVNFDVDEVLEGFVSSTGTVGSATGPYEPAPAPNGDIDEDDNGTNSAAGVASTTVSVSLGGEPTGDGDGANGNLTVDFGFYLPSAITGMAFDDLAHDGVRNGSDTGRAGIAVALVADGATLLTTTTAADGTYGFTNLGMRAYRVRFTVPTAWGASPADQGDDDTIDSDADPTGLTAPVPTGGNTVANVDLGIAGLDVGGSVWSDDDNDGQIGAGELGIAGVTVELLSGTTVVATATTDANGDYRFNRNAAGAYAVRIPAAEFLTGALVGLSSSTGSNRLTDGPYEPAPSGDTDIDDDDNGTTGATLVTADVTLAFGAVTGAEPTSDDGDDYTNLTVDLGFVDVGLVCIA